MDTFSSALILSYSTDKNPLLAVISTISAQLFEDCDHYKEITPGVLYTIHSPNYRDPYPAGTFCRYTGLFHMIRSLFN